MKKLTFRQKSVAFFVFCVAAAFLVSRSCKSQLASIERENGVERQVRYLCVKLLEKKVTAEELCSTTLTEIPQLRAHFVNLRIEDGEWYRKHGSNYYPSVDCSGEQPVFTLLGESFSCDRDKAVRLK